MTCTLNLRRTVYPCIVRSAGAADADLWNMTILPVQVLVAELLLPMVCKVGDYLLQQAVSSNGNMIVFRALVDSTTHGGIGALSWVVASNGVHNYSSLTETVLCGFLASALDADHFIAAGSFHLKNALSLTKRPPFHNTSLIPVIAIILYLVVKVFKLDRLSNLPWIFTIAWFSHHVRDATRRGLWFAPFGSTPPLPMVLYVGTVMVLPLVLRALFLYKAIGVKTSEPITNIFEGDSIV